MVDENIVASVRRYVQALEEQGYSIAFTVIFGSQVTGLRDEWSDIDLVVVSPQFDGEIGRSDVQALWRTAARTDSRIEPIPCGERQWTEDTSRAVIEIARREGHVVTSAA